MGAIEPLAIRPDRGKPPVQTFQCDERHSRCARLQVPLSESLRRGTKPQSMTRDSDYFRQRAAEARATASAKGRGEEAAVAGELALAYSALARRRAAADADAPATVAAVPELA